MLSVWLSLLLMVVLESDPRDDTLIRGALESCNEALAGEPCVDAHVGVPASLRALLTWPDPLHARVELRRSDGRTVLLRTVSFLPSDPPEERSRALGLVVASYILTQPAQTPSRVEPSLPRPPPPRRHALDLAGLGGPGLDDGRPRFGATLRARSQPSTAHPGLGLLVGARASYLPGDTRLTWVGISAGLSGRLRLPHALALEGRIEAAGQLLFARAHDPLTGAADRGRRVRLGGQAGLELVVPTTASLQLVLGAEIAHLRPRVAVIVGERRLGREWPVELVGLLGARLSW